MAVLGAAAHPTTDTERACLTLANQSVAQFLINTWLYSWIWSPSPHTLLIEGAGLISIATLASDCHRGVLALLTGLIALVPSLSMATPLPEAAERISLTSSLHYLEDKAGNLSIEDVRSESYQNQFQPSTAETPSFGFTESSYWFYTRIENSAPTPEPYLIAIEYPLLDNVEVYVVRERAEIERINVGDHQSFNERPIFHRNFLVTLPITANEPIDLFFRVTSSSSMQFPLALYGHAYLQKHEQTELIIQGIYYGTMLVMMLYNIFLFASLREMTYLYYVLYVASMTIFQAGLHGFAFQHLWPDGMWLNAKTIPCSVAGTVVFGGLFANSFLNLGSHAPRLQKFILGLVTIASLAMGLSLILPYAQAIRVVVVCGIIGSITYMTAGLLLWKRGHRFAKIYSVAWSSILAGAFLISTSKMGLLPRTFLTENGVQIGSLLEVILLSLALAQRLNQSLADKLKAERQTAKLESALNAELQTKIFLFSRVAHELNNPLNYSVGHLARMEESCSSLESFLNDIFVGSEEDPAAREALGIGQSHLGHLHDDIEGIDRSVKQTARVVAEMRSVSEVDGEVLKTTPIHDILGRVTERLEANIGQGIEEICAQIQSQSESIDEATNVFGNPYFFIHGITLAINALYNTTQLEELAAITHSREETLGHLEFTFTLRDSAADQATASLAQQREFEIAKYLLQAQDAELELQAQSTTPALLKYRFSIPCDLTKS